MERSSQQADFDKECVYQSELETPKYESAGGSPRKSRRSGASPRKKARPSAASVWSGQTPTTPLSPKSPFRRIASEGSNGSNRRRSNRLSLASLDTHQVRLLVRQTSSFQDLDQFLGERPAIQVKDVVDLMRGESVLLCCCGIVVLVYTSLDLVTPYVVSVGIDSAIQADGGNAKAYRFMGILIGVRTAVFCAKLLKEFLLCAASERTTSRIRHRLFVSILDQDMQLFRTEGSSLTTALTVEADNVKETFVSNVFDTLGAVLRIILCSTLLLSSAWKLAVLAFSVALIVGGMLAKWLGMLAASARSTLQPQRRAADVLKEGISNVATIRSYAAETLEILRYQQELGWPSKRAGNWYSWPSSEGTEYDTRLKQTLVAEVGLGILVLATFQLLSAIMWYAMHQLSLGTITFGGFVQFVFLTVHLIIGSASIGKNIQSMSTSLASLERILQILTREPEVPRHGGRRLHTLLGEVRFKNVDFAYPTAMDNLILMDVSFTIPANSSAAFVGPSGCGKSTVLGILERFHNVVGGAVFIDDAPIRDLDVVWLRQRMSFVTQEPILFARSIRENVCYRVEAGAAIMKGPSGEDLGLEAAMELACKKANVYDFVMQMPRGFDTILSESGGGLSGGQRQRIVIAQALLADPRILLLDEATSALDPLSEELVQAAVNEASRGRTVISVAHRFDAFKDADQIFVLANQGIVDHGTHSELFERCDLYHGLVEKQIGKGQHAKNDASQEQVYNV